MTQHSFDQVVDFLAQQVTTPGHLVGYSMGARLGLGLLKRYPHLFVKATFIGVHPGLTSEQERAERWAQDQQWITLLRKEGIEAFVNAWEKQPIFASQARLPKNVLQVQRERRLSHDPHRLADALEVLSLARMPSFWGENLPVQLVVGELDSKFRALAERTGWPTRIIKNSGHNVLLEAPELLAL